MRPGSFVVLKKLMGRVRFRDMGEPFWEWEHNRPVSLSVDTLNSDEGAEPTLRSMPCGQAVRRAAPPALQLLSGPAVPASPDHLPLPQPGALGSLHELPISTLSDTGQPYAFSSCQGTESTTPGGLSALWQPPPGPRPPYSLLVDLKWPWQQLFLNALSQIRAAT